MKSEKRIEQEIMLALSSEGVKIFKNATGMVSKNNIGDRVIRYGLCKGGSDLIGITPVVITPDMVGSKVAVFTAIEVKKSRTGYKATEEQKRFVDMVIKEGGKAGIAYDVESAKKILDIE